MSLLVVALAITLAIRSYCTRAQHTTQSCEETIKQETQGLVSRKCFTGQEAVAAATSSLCLAPFSLLCFSFPLPSFFFSYDI